MLWFMAADNWQLYTPLLLWTIGQEVGGGESGIRCPDLLLFTEWSVPGNCSLWRHLPSTSDLSTSSDFTFRFIRSSQPRSSVSPHAVLGEGYHLICLSISPDMGKHLGGSCHFLIISVGFCTSILLVGVLVSTTMLVYRKYIRHQRLLSSLDNESPGEEGEQVLSISLQCNCQQLEKDNTGSDSLEQTLIEF